MERIINDIIASIKDYFKNDYSGHDTDHTMRVYHLATTIVAKEHADLFIVQLAALLHDVDDRKLSPETADDLLNAQTMMRQQPIDDKTIDRVCHIIRQVSFKGSDSITPDTIEGQCVQDADRLDAMGAIGIARAFAFGGSHHRIMYDPDIPPLTHMDQEMYYNHTNGTTINHFYEKLLKLKDLMSTDTAKSMALHRHQYMVEFLNEFVDEYEGIK